MSTQIVTLDRTHCTRQGRSNMPAAFAHALTQAYEAKPRGQRYFKKEEVEALVSHLAAMDPQLFRQHPVSDRQVSSVFPRDRVLSLQGPLLLALVRLD